MIVVHWRPRGRDVTVVAIPAGYEVRGRLARRDCSIVATGAGTGRHRMIERCRGPGQRGMTIAALSCRDNMIDRLSGRRCPIVAA